MPLPLPTSSGVIRWYEVSRPAGFTDNMGAVTFDLYGDVQTTDTLQSVWWRLREGAGFVASDSGQLSAWGSVGGWNGTIQPSMTWWVEGRGCGRGGGRL